MEKFINKLEELEKSLKNKKEELEKFLESQEVTPKTDSEKE